MHRKPMWHVNYLFANELPLSIELIKHLLYFDGKRCLSFPFQGQSHLIDAVQTWLDSVDVIHKSLANRNRMFEIDGLGHPKTRSWQCIDPILLDGSEAVAIITANLP